MILVVGATGYMGRETVKQLLAAGYPVRAMTRTPENARDLEQLGADVVVGDLIDPHSLAYACWNVEGVVADLYKRAAGKTARVTHMPRMLLKVMPKLMQSIKPEMVDVIKLSYLSDTQNQAFDPCETLEQYPLELTRLEDFVREKAAEMK